MEISPGRHLPTCGSLTAGRGGGSTWVEAMLPIEKQIPGKTSMDG